MKDLTEVKDKWSLQVLFLYDGRKIIFIRLSLPKEFNVECGLISNSFEMYHKTAY